MTALTAAHITHEACEKIGGIGAVLEGFITSPVYQQHVKRTIIVGPYANHLDVPPNERLGCAAHVLYSTIDKVDEVGLAGKLHPIEWAFNVAIVYGKRQFQLPGSDDHTGEAEIVLIDVFNISKQRVNQFKRKLSEMLGINSMRYEADWGYEEYVRLAEPAFYALLALLQDDELPCLLFSHEFMGLPTAFKAIFDGQRQFRTVFHAHECGTARHIVEQHPGHDVAFYNILKQALPRKLYVEDVFGDRSDSARHALISRAHMCDAIVAVGDYTAQEIHFLGDHFDHHHIDLIYNGVPHLEVEFNSKLESRDMLATYAERLLGWRPDVLMTHVTRPVISKGIWRDLQVCHELDAHFARTNQRGALFILTSAGGTRRSQDVRQMEAEYGWPRKHRVGYPDLVGPEVDFDHMIEDFNAHHERVQAVLVNQFGWSRQRVGQRVPQGMTIADLRRATDVEFGMATYEPFGISPLEPLGAGALCVISSVCGCKGFVEEALGTGDEALGARHEALGQIKKPSPFGRGLGEGAHDVQMPTDTPSPLTPLPKGERNGGVSSAANIIVADYIGGELDHERSIEELLRMTQSERDAIEQRVAKEIADELLRRLPRDDAGRRVLLDNGQELVKRLGWDQVLEAKMIPMLRRVMANGERNEASKPQRRPAAVNI